MNSERVSAGEIVNEILPLLKDYFVANCHKDGNTIVMTFSDGQIVTVNVTA